LAAGVTKRCTLIIPDAGPFNSLWVASALPLLLKLDMPIIVLDAVYDELTSDVVNFAKDRDVKAFIDGNQPPFVIEETETGREERTKRRAGGKPRRNAGNVAIADFMSEGIDKYVSASDPVVVLFEDSDLPMVRFFQKPPNLHLLSTVGMLRGLERVGMITSADAIIHEMTHPSSKERRPRAFKDLPLGIDAPAMVGSEWLPRSRG
jgi:hypothetical protein